MLHPWDGGPLSSTCRFDFGRMRGPPVRIDRRREVTHHPAWSTGGLSRAEPDRHGADLHLYLRELGSGACSMSLAVLATGRRKRIEGLTCVWLEGQKVARVRVEHDVYQHGS